MIRTPENLSSNAGMFNVCSRSLIINISHRHGHSGLSHTLNCKGHREYPEFAEETKKVGQTLYCKRMATCFVNKFLESLEFGGEVGATGPIAPAVALSMLCG